MTELEQKQSDLEHHEARAKKLQSMAMDLLDDFSLHFMDKARAESASKKPDRQPQRKPAEKQRPAPERQKPPPVAEVQRAKPPVVDEALAKIVEAIHRILENMDDWIDAPSMAVKLLASGFRTDLEPGDLAHAVREAFQILGQRVTLEISTKAGVGRLYRLKGD